MGRSGQAITLVGAVDLPKLQEIERGIGRKLPRITSTGGPTNGHDRPAHTPVHKQTSAQRQPPRGSRFEPAKPATAGRTVHLPVHKQAALARKARENGEAQPAGASQRRRSPSAAPPLGRRRRQSHQT
jgi:hypothetical protein